MVLLVKCASGIVNLPAPDILHGWDVATTTTLAIEMLALRSRLELLDKLS
jgi:hypothetical protein